MTDLRNVVGVEKTNNTKKISYRGELKSFPIYRIPINLLYYNVQNDRIATWISKHEAMKGKINADNHEEFNNILETYMISSNEKAFQRTKNNIKALGQREAGIVLKNGIIIDGNRRFTCLRRLYDETKDNAYYYFETVILDVESTPRDIKLLELEIQHGQDEKVDYNPIEKLVGIYNDVIKNKILTAQEYAKSIDVTIGDMNKLIEQAEIMMDFLDYINASEQFYIARELELDGPLLEIQKIKRATPNEIDWDIKRVILYDNMLAKAKGDITRMIRSIGDIMKSENYEEYCEKHFEVSKKINNKLKQVDKIDTAFIRNEIRGNNEIKESLQENYESINEKTKKTMIRKLPIDMIENINDNLDKIDEIAMIKLQGVDRENFMYALKCIKNKIEKIEEQMNEQ